MEILARYPGLTAARVAGLVLLVLALRLVIVPFALVAVLLDRTQGRLTDVVAAIEPHPNTSSTQDASAGGEHR
jgi:hypothetical protein